MPRIPAMLADKTVRLGGLPEQSLDPTELLQWLYPRLRVTARALVPVASVDDLVHESIVCVLTAYPGFHGIRHPLAYCRKTMLRIVARTAARDRAAGEELLGEIDARLESPQRVDPNLRLALESAMRTLGPRQRSCVYLRFICGLTDRESAQVLGCKPSSVRSQTARALKALRMSLADLEDTTR